MERLRREERACKGGSEGEADYAGESKRAQCQKAKGRKSVKVLDVPWGHGGP